MSWRVLLGLVACNAIWATNPLMAKVLMRDFPPLQVSWMRYSSALAVTLLLLPLLRRRRILALSPLPQLFSPAHLPWVAAMGLITFFGSAVFQYQGLSLSTSTANAIIVAMEPLFAVFLAWILLGEVLRKRQVFAFFLALVGFGLLSSLKPLDFLGSLALFSFGNLLILLAMPMEATYSIVSRRLAGKVEPFSLFAGALAIGLLAFSTYLLWSGIGLPDRPPSSPLQWMAVLLMGPLGTAITYTFWTVALVKASVAAVSLTLFVQPILGAVFGALFLDERMDAWQAFGGGLILGALVLQTTLSMKRRRPS